MIGTIARWDLQHRLRVGKGGEAKCASWWVRFRGPGSRPRGLRCCCRHDPGEKDGRPSPLDDRCVGRSCKGDTVAQEGGRGYNGNRVQAVVDSWRFCFLMQDQSALLWFVRAWTEVASCNVYNGSMHVVCFLAPSSISIPLETQPP